MQAVPLTLPRLPHSEHKRCWESVQDLPFQIYLPKVNRPLSPTTMAANSPFLLKDLYPSLEQSVKPLLNGDCAQPYQDYLQKPSLARCGTAVECMLEHLPETVKADMASAGVLLGLLPAILGILGSSTVEVSCLATRRPILAFLLCLGSPAVNPVRLYDYKDTLENILDLGATVQLPFMTGSSQRIVLVLKYVLVLAAIANVSLVNYDISLGTVWNPACSNTFFTVLYGVLTIFPHFAGIMAFSRRVEIHFTDQQDAKQRLGILRRLRYEFTFNSRPSELQVRLKKGTLIFIILASTTTTLTVLHIIWGIYTFSSLLFIGSKDALAVVARYIASVIVCRAVLMHELASMKGASGLSMERSDGPEQVCEIEAKR